MSRFMVPGIDAGGVRPTSIPGLIAWLRANNNTYVAGNAPAFTAADDSIGLVDATLTGFSSEQTLAAWRTDVPATLATGYSMWLDGGTNKLLLSETSLGTIYTFALWLKSALFLETVGGEVASNGSSVLSQSFGTTSHTPFGGTSANITHTPDANSWHHYAITRVDTIVQFYVDGLAYEGMKNLGLNPGLTLGCIGGYSDNDTVNMTGGLDDFRIYSVGKTAVQIAAIAAGVDDQVDLTHHWSFNDAFAGNPVDNDSLLNWTDKTTNRYQYLQATAAAKPTYQTSQFGSHPGIEFATNDYLRVANTIVSTSEHTLGIVFTTPASFSGDHVLIGTSDESESNKYGWIGFDAAGKLCVACAAAGAESRSTGDTILSVSTKYYAVFIFDGSAWVIRLKGVAETLTAANAIGWDDITSRDAVVLGAVIVSGVAINHLAGLIADLAIYSNDVSIANLLRLEKYFRTRYGII